MRGLAVFIQRRVLSTGFVPMLMREFDAIFDMDCMMRHKSLINCQKKNVQLHLSRIERVTFEDRGRRVSFITFQRPRQLVESGYEAFLTRIVVTGEQPDPVTSDVLTGGGITHTVPAEAAELPTTRLTELTIEVLPGDASTFYGFVPGLIQLD